MEWLKSLFPNLRQASVRWSEDDASSLAASVAYYLALSLFPLCLMLVSGLGLFLNFTSYGQEALQKLVKTVENQGSQLTKQHVAEAISNMDVRTAVAGPIASKSTVPGSSKLNSDHSSDVQEGDAQDDAIDDAEASEQAKQRLLETIEAVSSESVRKQLAQVISSLGNQSVFSTPLSFLAAALAAIGVFAQLDRGFDRIWRVPAPKDASLFRMVIRVVRHRFMAFTMLVCLGGMVALLFVGSMAWAQIRSFAGATLPSLTNIFGLLDFLFMTLANGILFALVYRWLPKRPVGWHEALRGGLLASLIWQLGRYVLGSFFIGMQYSTAYGAVGSLIAILLWCYYGVSIIFFGAEYVQVIQERRANRTVTNSGGIIANPMDTVSHDSNANFMQVSPAGIVSDPNTRNLVKPKIETNVQSWIQGSSTGMRQRPRARHRKPNENQ